MHKYIQKILNNSLTFMNIRYQFNLLNILHLNAMGSAVRLKPIIHIFMARLAQLSNLKRIMQFYCSFWKTLNAIIKVRIYYIYKRSTKTWQILFCSIHCQLCLMQAIFMKRRCLHFSWESQQIVGGKKYIKLPFK